MRMPSSPRETPARGGHAVLDLATRRLKAMKVERLLRLAPSEAPRRLLEVGVGSGGIAHYFGTRPELRLEVDGVDVEDVRTVTDGYRFQLVGDTRLPFPDRTFDFVVTNHVIEHVGARAAQVEHLREIRRVLKPDGYGYLAVPNRWQVVEPHFRLAFLSWLPRRFRSAYLRLARKGRIYDCAPLTVGELEALFADAGLKSENITVEALRETLRIEHPDSLARRIAEREFSGRVLQGLRRLIPTLIYRFAERADALPPRQPTE